MYILFYIILLYYCIFIVWYFVGRCSDPCHGLRIQKPRRTDAPSVAETTQSLL